MARYQRLGQNAQENFAHSKPFASSREGNVVENNSLAVTIRIAVLFQVITLAQVVNITVL